MKLFLKKIQSLCSFQFLSKKLKEKSAQNAIEYILIFASVVMVVILAAGPKGFLTTTLNQSLELTMNGIETVGSEPCLGTLDTVDGTWTGGWVDNEVCGATTACEKEQIQTCVLGACNGTCKGSAPIRVIGCHIGLCS